MGIKSPDGTIGKACFSIDALTQIAMERHHSAREAIKEMGALAVEMGFYGAGYFEGSAESLLVTDKEEAWVFHIVPDPTGSSAIWAAQRVPDDGFVVVANAFIIREINFEDDANFLFSESVQMVAEAMGWWSSTSGDPLDFTALYSDGEYSHKYYSGRRSWGVFHLFAPSLKLDPDYEEWRISNPYPFAAKPDRPIALADMARAMRYFYQGTEYSQAGRDSKLPLAGGPWNSPDHVAGDTTGSSGPNGNWERTVGLYRSSDTYIVQSRGWLPDDVGGTLWWGAYAAPYAVYVPFSAGVKSLPDATLGHHLRLDKETFFWANRYVGNYVQLKWEIMMEEVLMFQDSVLGESLAVQAEVDELYVAAMDGDTGDNDETVATTMADLLSTYQTNAEQILKRTWELTDHLMFKYADGQIHYTIPSEGPLSTSTTPRQFDANGMTVSDAAVVDQPGYPNGWLEAVGYVDGPPPPPDCGDLEWKCGHRVPALSSSSVLLEDGSKRNRLRGDNYSGGSSVDDSTWMVDTWREYLHSKAEAIDKGIAGCSSRGDVSVAVSGSSCKVVMSTKGSIDENYEDIMIH